MVTLCRRLRLKYVREQVAEVLLTARAQRWDPAEAAAGLLLAEFEGRDRSTIESRRAGGPLPGRQDLRQLESRRRSSIPAATQRALRSLEWVERAENLVVAGPSGNRQVPSARSHRPPRGRPRAVRRLVLCRGPRGHRSDVTGSTTRCPRPSPPWPLRRSPLVDDIGLLAHLDRRRRRPLPLGRRRLRDDGRWPSRPTCTPPGFDQLMDKTIASALVDRLMHHAHVVVTDGESVRLADALAGKGVVPLD